MKRSEILFGLLKIPVDALAVLLGLTLAYQLRQANIDLLPTVQLVTSPAQLPAFSYYLTNFVTYALLLYLFLLAALKLYALRVTASAWREMGYIIIASGLWIALIIAWFSLVERQLLFSRLLLLHSVFLITLFVMLGRVVVILLQRVCLLRGIGIRRVVSFGSQALPASINRILISDARFKYLGHLINIDELMIKEQSMKPDLVMHTDPNPQSGETVHLINHCRNYHIGYAFLPPVFADVPHQLVIDHLGLTPILTFQPTPLDGWGRVVKRVLDIILSLIGLIILSPLLLLIAILNLLFSGFPIFYVSHRVGQHGTSSIPILKFRTMHRGADDRKKELEPLSHRADGPLFKIKNDPRVTPFGRLLRRLSIDELPQLLNVLCGHLSLVGPRPHLKEEVARYNEDQRRVFAVKPGITGLAQVSGRSSLPFDAEVALDLKYIEEWSPLLDIWIIWRTVFVVLMGKGAD